MMRTVGKTTNRFGLDGKLGEFEIAKLELNPGDTVVLRTEKELSRDQSAALKDAAKAHFPNNEVLVLSGGLSMAVLSKKQAA